jgi:peptidoglycan hydrolase CwlO-like protein
MAAPLDHTEQLLATLEPELAEKEARVHARLDREKAQVDELTGQLQSLTLFSQATDAEFAKVAPQRDALVRERDALAQAGSKGNKARAALWSTATAGCGVGVMVSTFSLMTVRHGELFWPAIGGAVAAGVAGLLAAGWARRWL